MSRIVLLCLRSPSDGARAHARARLEAFLAALRPDHLPQARSVIVDDGSGLLLGVFHPPDERCIQGTSAYAGWLLDGADRWSAPGSDVPDGTFGLFRSDAQTVELVADATGSRTIWYAASDEVFVASTSQRAIPWFLGGFEPNPAAPAWMLGHGTCGPDAAWDRRARAVPPRGRLTLDRGRWRVHETADDSTVPIEPGTTAQHAERLRAALDDTFSRAQFDWGRWVLPLSGGIDCRAIALWLKDRASVRTITWGRRAARSAPGNDAFVAGKVAAALGVPNQFFEMDGATEAPDRILARFLLAGEGRVDHIAAYLDGFALWRTLVAAGVTGIVRGDEAFGMEPVADADEARLRLELWSWRSLPGLPGLADLGLDHLREAALPAELAQRPDESPEDWLHRGMLAYRALDLWAPLNDLKTPYVEIASPLLTRRIVDVVRSEPSRLRIDKRLFRAVVAPRDVPFAYATERAIAYPAEALAGPAMTELLRDALASRATREQLSPKFAAFVLAALGSGARAGTATSLRARLKRSLAARLPRSIRAHFRTPLRLSAPSARQLALRAYLITQMGTRLAADGSGA